MFPSNSNNYLNNSGNELPVCYPYVDQSLSHSRPFLHDITPLTPNSSSTKISNSINLNPKPNSKQQEQQEEEDPHCHPPLSFFCLPSDDDVLLFRQHHYHDHVDLSLHDSQVLPLIMRKGAATAAGNTTLADDQYQMAASSTPTLNIKMVDWDSSKNQDMMNTDQPQIPGRRSCKRDRHSKIITAQGPRDRRMRLSLEVARKFFGLQDVLGFDKASKTVEWLLIQAGHEIKKLMRDQFNSPHMMSCTKGTSPATSESCEVVSGVDEATTNIDNGGNVVDKLSRSRGIKPSAKERKVARQLSRKRAFHPLLAKASREKARARARERTRENIQKNQRERVVAVVDDDVQSKKPCDDRADLSRLSSWSPFETGEESAGTQSYNNNMNFNSTNHDPNSLEVLAHHYGVEEPMSNSQAGDQDLVAHHGTTHDPLVVMGKWSPPSIFTSLQQNTEISQEHHQFADFQFFGKPWEAYNNTHNLF